MSGIDPWVSGILVTSFDEKKGPVVLYSWPSSFLSPALQKEVVLYSLPKVSQKDPASCFFVFRLRCDKDTPYFDYPFREHSFLYGYVYFQ